MDLRERKSCCSWHDDLNQPGDDDEEVRRDARDRERMRIMGLMFNVRGTVHPMAGEQYSPNTLGSLSRVVDVFGKQGHPKDGG